MAKTLEELNDEVNKLQRRVRKLRKQHAGKEATAAASFPRTIELTTRFAENDEIIVTTSGWYYDGGHNHPLCVTYSTEWTGNRHALTFNVYNTEGLGLSPAAMVSLSWHAKTP